MQLFQLSALLALAGFLLVMSHPDHDQGLYARDFDDERLSVRDLDELADSLSVREIKYLHARAVSKKGGKKLHGLPLTHYCSHCDTACREVLNTGSWVCKNHACGATCP